MQPRVDLVHDGDEVLAEHVAQRVHLRDVLQDPVEPLSLQRFHNMCQFVSVMLQNWKPRGVYFSVDVRVKFLRV